MATAFFIIGDSGARFGPFACTHKEAQLEADAIEVESGIPHYPWPATEEDRPFYPLKEVL